MLTDEHLDLIAETKEALTKLTRRQIKDTNLVDLLLSRLVEQSLNKLYSAELIDALASTIEELPEK